MKYYLLVFILVISVDVFSQLKFINVMIGKTDTEVNYYLNSLNKLKPNIYSRIEKNVGEDGNLILKNDFSIVDESFFTCTTVVMAFIRTNGKEICGKQLIIGSAEFAYLNLNYIKDNFKYISDNRWEYPYPDDLPMKIAATFERKNGQYPTYEILYELLPKK